MICPLPYILTSASQGRSVHAMFMKYGMRCIYNLVSAKFLIIRKIIKLLIFLHCRFSKRIYKKMEYWNVIYRLQWLQRNRLKCKIIKISRRLNFSFYCWPLYNGGVGRPNKNKNSSFGGIRKSFEQIKELFEQIRFVLTN